CGRMGEHVAAEKSDQPSLEPPALLAQRQNDGFGLRHRHVAGSTRQPARVGPQATRFSVNGAFKPLWSRPNSETRSGSSALVDDEAELHTPPVTMRAAGGRGGRPLGLPT